MSNLPKSQSPPLSRSPPVAAIAALAAFAAFAATIHPPSVSADESGVAAVVHRVAAHEFHPVRNGFTRDRGLGKAGVASLEDPDWRVRTLAVRDLVRLGPDAVAEIAQALDHEDLHVRQIAATALGVIGREEAAEALADALAKDEDSLVRTQAVIALRQIGLAESLPDVLRALEDEDGDVRHQAELAAHSLRQGYSVESELAAAFGGLEEEDFDRAEVGQEAPDFALDAADGGRWRLSDLRGKSQVLLVWIFADW